MTSESSMGYIHSYETFGAVDGPGIRFIVFMQGCRLRCRYCHNPDTWEFKKGSPVSAAEVLSRILEYRSYIKRGGVTISGGEPLEQHDFVLELLRLLHEYGLHTAIDTAGSLPLGKTHDIIETADMLLLDIKELDARDAIALTGMSSRNTLDTLDYTRDIGKPVWIRHVLVPNVTMISEKLERLADYLRRYPNIERVDLLPFHKMGEYKWEGCGTPYTLKNTKAPSADELERAKQIFKKAGLPVK
ncbi:MAG: pyruvate formate-lyase-activating protein [Eubacteriales bacterium]|nr:pyruvate formate-lyase-activating protein [Eubacteriales bacterium]MDD3882501.1 pyruvate formate-lyase-activating protein [Eubacteriales bacterium]MDD4512801.1 pyruvate formate-lyase-activating protein [Eubacteriales bacterium]